MTRRVLRSEIPVDDRWHTITVRGPLLAAACRTPHAVDVWWISDDQAQPQDVQLRAYGTGQADVEGTHAFTALAAGGRLVWHLFRRTP